MVNKVIKNTVKPLLKPVWTRVRGTSPRTDYLFHHAFPNGPPPVTIHAPNIAVCDEDILLAQRVIKAFHAAIDHEKTFSSENAGGDLWSSIARSSHAAFVQLLLQKDARATATMLVNALHHPVANGLCWDAGSLTYQRLLDRSDRVLKKLLVDRFVALAEALGVIQVEFPEWGQWGKNVYLNLAALYDKVEAALGFSLAIRDCFGLYGIAAGPHRIYMMTATHAYLAWRLQRLLSDERLPPDDSKPRICEIGGGYGGVACYSFRRPLQSYVIIDIPVINALQGYFLMKTCGPDKVQLYGEQETDRPLRVLPYWMMRDMPDRHFDIVVSQESLPEIERLQAEAYVRDIHRVSAKYFLSINQETGATISGGGFQHNRVSELVEQHGGFDRRCRFPYWIRRGEVEELFSIVR